MREIKFRQWDSIRGIYYRNIGATPGCWSCAPFVSWDRYPLEQFTGLLDRNGKEIYEGDIVTWGYGPTAVRFAALEEDNEEGYPVKRIGWIVDDCFLDGNCEVIGNIHENPELLEVPK